MNQDTLFWLFSTIAQAYGAIVGIVGLLVVYRLDNQNRLRESIRQRLIDPPRKYLPGLFGALAYGWSPEQITYYYHNPQTQQQEDTLLRLKKNTEDWGYLKNEVERIDASVKMGASIRTDFKSFMKFHIPIIIVSIFLIHIVSLPFLLPTRYHTVIGFILFGIVLVAIAVVLFKSSQQIWSMAMSLLE